jgi:hypothetical protein
LPPNSWAKVPCFQKVFDEDAIAMMNMFIETSLLQYYDNNDDIYDDGIKMNELLLVSRIIYSLLNKANHVKVEAHMAPPLPLTSLSIPQYPIYKIENNRKQHSNHA